MESLDVIAVHIFKDSDDFISFRPLNYKYLADADKNNTFDVERYMKKKKQVVSKNETFDMYELGRIDA